jgi:hypothetical protein
VCVWAFVFRTGIENLPDLSASTDFLRYLISGLSLILLGECDIAEHMYTLGIAFPPSKKFGCLQVNERSLLSNPSIKSASMIDIRHLHTLKYTHYILISRTAKHRYVSNYMRSLRWGQPPRRRRIEWYTQPR